MVARSCRLAQRKRRQKSPQIAGFPVHAAVLSPNQAQAKLAAAKSQLASLKKVSMYFGRTLR